MKTDNLMRGDMVVASRDLDPSGANVRKNTLGVVFEETNAYGDDGGPMVRWFSGGACNVYEGDVEMAADAYEDQPVGLPC